MKPISRVTADVLDQEGGSSKHHICTLRRIKSSKQTGFLVDRANFTFVKTAYLKAVDYSENNLTTIFGLKISNKKARTAVLTKLNIC